jgi:hypothetical protein
LSIKTLEDCMKKQKIQLKINYNEMQRLFIRTNNQIIEFSDVCTNSNIKTILHGDLNSEGMFALSVNVNCEFSIGALKNGKYQEIENHMGNINKLLKIEKFYDEKSVELLETLIQYAYRTLINFDNENIVKYNDIFEVKLNFG